MKNQQHAIFYGLVSVLLWSTVATAFKLALIEISPTQLLAIAASSSFVVLISIVIYQGKVSQLKVTLMAQWRYLLLISLINPLAYYLTLFGAYDRLPASEAQPLNYTWAIALTVMSVLFLGQKAKLQDWLACILGYFGVLVIATRGDITGMAFTNSIGVGLAILSTLLWASYWIISTKKVIDNEIGLTITFGMASLIIWPFIIFWEPIASISLIAVSAAIYVGFFEMGVTFLFWMMAMKKAENTSMVGNLIFISPFLSLILLSQILGETIYKSTIVGLILIILALVIQQLKRKAS